MKEVFMPSLMLKIIRTVSVFSLAVNGICLHQSVFAIAGSNLRL